MAASILTKAGTLIKNLLSGSKSIWIGLLPWGLVAAAMLTAFWQYTSRVKAEASIQNDRQWQQRLNEFEQKSFESIERIYNQSVKLADLATKNTYAQRKATQEALKSIQDSAAPGAYTEIVNGQCLLKPEYVEAFNRIHNTLPGASK